MQVAKLFSNIIHSATLPRKSHHNLQGNIYPIFFSPFFWPWFKVYGILIPQGPGTEPRPSPVKVWNPIHQTAREFPYLILMYGFSQVAIWFVRPSLL